jgi:hypothetical protein
LSDGTLHKRDNERILVLGNPAPSRRRWNKLTGKQMMVVTWPHDLPRREPTLEAERILMVDFTATQAQANGAAPSANREGGRPRPL